MTPAVFLDRDGTLIEEVGYLDRLDRMALYPWSVDAVRLLNRAGFRVVVVTNQAGVARGLIEEEFVQEAHRYLSAKMQAGRATIDAYYYCPHHPDAPLERYRQRCACRKPSPGMVRNAERDLSLDVARSFVVGDRWGDIDLARAVGATGILVRTGYGDAEAARQPAGQIVGAIVSTLIDAVAWILRQSALSRRRPRSRAPSTDQQP